MPCGSEVSGQPLRAIWVLGRSCEKTLPMDFLAILRGSKRYLQAPKIACRASNAEICGAGKYHISERGFFHSFPASLVVRASPPSHTARPFSRELPVDPYRDHRWDFPCCAWSTLLACRRQYPGRSDGIYSLVPFHHLRPSLEPGRVGSCITLFEACSAFITLRPARSPSRLATLCTRGFSSFVASTTALIATGWSEPVPGRVYLPLWTTTFHGAPGSCVN